MKKVYLVAVALLVSLFSAFAQDEGKAYSLDFVPKGADNKAFAICYYNGKKVYNLRSMLICKTGNINSIKISPASFSFAVMYEKGKGREIGIYSTASGKCFHVFKFKKGSMPTDFCFTADARYLIVSTENREILIYQLKNYKLSRTIYTPLAPDHITISNNRYHIAISVNSTVYVFNFEKGTKRAEIEIGDKVKEIEFTNNSDRMGVLTANGQLQMFETRKFTKVQEITGLKHPVKMAFHKEEKYISVITSTNEIVVLNRKDAEDNFYVDSRYNGVNHVGYAKSLKGGDYLIYDNDSDFVFQSIDFLRPNYQKIVADSVDLVMSDWSKRMKGESLEDYRKRVNDESREKKRQELEYDISTVLAGNILDSTEATLGNYDMKDSILEVKLENMPSIYFKVDQSDLVDFVDANDLVFDNSVYSVDDKDNFVLMYTEITNKKNGKKYVFDNLSKNELQYDADDTETFVPLEVIQKSEMDEIKLEKMKEEIVAQAMDSSLITDHTHIDVKTDVVMSVDADGNSIMNYNVDFNYNVDEEFSAQDDYKAGDYVCANSEAAMAMLRIVSKAMDEQFSTYMKSGKKVLISVYGSADASPVNRVIKYNGEYGDFENEIYYNNGELGAITVTKSTGITSNEQLSFIRAAGVKNYVETNIKQLQEMDAEYTFYVKVSEQSGAEYRRIGVKFTFIDVFGDKSETEQNKE